MLLKYNRHYIDLSMTKRTKGGKLQRYLKRIKGKVSNEQIQRV